MYCADSRVDKGFLVFNTKTFKVDKIGCDMDVDLAFCFKISAVH